MRRCVTVILAVAVLTAALGGGMEYKKNRVSQHYQQELVHLGGLLAERRWQEAGQALEALRQEWQRDGALVQLWVHHAETDAVSHALRSLGAALSQKNETDALLYFGDCLENFDHLHRRDAFTLKNIL